MGGLRESFRPGSTQLDNRVPRPLKKIADNMHQSVYNRKHARLEDKFNIIG